VRNAGRAEDGLLTWLEVDVRDDEIPTMPFGAQEIPLHPISIEGIHFVECVLAATLCHRD
jgi:hypothetical protein